MRLSAGLCSDTGRRRERNEDAVFIDDDLALFALADGMGGHRGGAVASATALEALRAGIANGRALNDAIVEANRAVWERGHADPNLLGMGTTVTAMLVLPGETLLVGHVGDSRGYRIRNGTIERVTDDHSLVEELVRDGTITREQAEVHPQRSIVTRALGVDADVEVDIYTLAPIDHDRVILCSDGLTDMLRDRRILEISNEYDDPTAAATALVDAANEAGGHDNVSVVVIDITDVGPRGPDAPLDALPLLEEAGRRVPTDAPAPVAAPQPPVPPVSRRRRVVSVLLYVVPLLLIAAATVAALGWYARSAYFVSVDGTQIVVMKGRPGGVFGWKPTIEDTTGVVVGDLPASAQQELVDGVAAEGSLDDALAYVERLRASTTTTATTPPRTTTSTAQATTTTRAPTTTSSRSVTTATTRPRTSSTTRATTRTTQP